MIVAGVQFDIAWQDVEANLGRLESTWVPRATNAGARLVVLPEMFATGFSMDAARIAEPPGGPVLEWMRRTAAEHGCWLMGSVAVVDDSRATNRMYLTGPDDEVVHYDKRHPFSYAGEDRHFRGGDELVTVTVDGLRITPFVCYDLRFADDFWTAGPQTDVFVVVANWPSARSSHWTALLAARAIENQCYVVGVNRVGAAEGLDHDGHSAIIDPLGRTISAAAVGETLVLADLEPTVVGDVRSRFPFLADRKEAPRHRKVNLGESA